MSSTKTKDPKVLKTWGSRLTSFKTFQLQAFLWYNAGPPLTTGALLPNPKIKLVFFQKFIFKIHSSTSNYKSALFETSMFTFYLLSPISALLLSAIKNLSKKSKITWKHFGAFLKKWRLDFEEKVFPWWNGPKRMLYLMEKIKPNKNASKVRILSTFRLGHLLFKNQFDNGPDTFCIINGLNLVLRIMIA